MFLRPPRPCFASVETVSGATSAVSIVQSTDFALLSLPLYEILEGLLVSVVVGL